MSKIFIIESSKKGPFLSSVSLTRLKVNRPSPSSYYMLCRTIYYRRIIVLFGDRSFILTMQLCCNKTPHFLLFTYNCSYLYSHLNNKILVVGGRRAVYARDKWIQLCVSSGDFVICIISRLFISLLLLFLCVLITMCDLTFSPHTANPGAKWPLKIVIIVVWLEWLWTCRRVAHDGWASSIQKIIFMVQQWPLFCIRQER